jgi:hypothetical protein
VNGRAEPARSGLHALQALERFARRRPRGARCELCADALGERHRHVVDVADRRLLCTCGACAMLLAGQRRGRYRAVPDRVRVDPTWAITEEELDALGIPVGLAFFFHPSTQTRWTAVFPSPAGATEAELPDAAWEALCEGSDLVQSIEDDVEALLVHRYRDGRRWCAVVPIDVCYDLTGLLRRHWRGIDGGDEARRVLDEFLERLMARSEPLGLGGEAS